MFNYLLLSYLLYSTINGENSVSMDSRGKLSYSQDFPTNITQIGIVDYNPSTTYQINGKVDTPQYPIINPCSICSKDESEKGVNFHGEVHRVGVRHDSHSHSTSTPKKKKINWIGFLSTFLSCVLITILPLFGYIFYPLMKNQDVFDSFGQFFAALGFSTLSSDGILHLIPHALGLHSHDHGDHSHSHHRNDLMSLDSYIWKLSVVILGMTIFYIMDVIVNIWPTHGKSSSHCCHGHNHEGNTEHSHNPSHNCHPCPVVEAIPTESPEKSVVAIQSSQDKDEKLNLSSILMIFCSHLLHHPLDGVAIGSAFVNSDDSGFQLGLSTLVAIIAHEFPHILWDISCFLKANKTLHKSVFLTIISTSPVLIGGLIGALASYSMSSASLWINAFTAGLFLYLGFSTSIHHMLSAYRNNRLNKAFVFFLQMLGFMCGYGLMLLIAIFEDKFH